jgi:hypothetical protein
MPDEQNVGCSDIASENGLPRQISMDRQEERRPGVLNLRVQKKKSRFVRPSGHSTRPIPPKLSSIFDEIFGEAEAKDELLALGPGVSDGTADPLSQPAASMLERNSEIFDATASGGADTLTPTLT